MEHSPVAINRIRVGGHAFQIPNSKLIRITPLPWNFYAWFVFAALFIAAYFAWVWTSARSHQTGTSEDADVQS
jgi:hypothetical protein